MSRAKHRPPGAANFEKRAAGRECVIQGLFSVRCPWGRDTRINAHAEGGFDLTLAPEAKLRILQALSVPFRRRRFLRNRPSEPRSAHVQAAVG